MVKDKGRDHVAAARADLEARQERAKRGRLERDALEERASDALGDLEAQPTDLPGRITARMKVLNLNPFSAANKAGLKPDYVRDILRGKVKNPSAEKLGKLAAALECSLYYLLGREEMQVVGVDPDTGEEDPPPPAPLPTWSPAEGKPVPVLLPIRYEIMAETWRSATEAVRTPLGWEAATIPPTYAGRDSWWEVLRDRTMNRIAPLGSLVQVVAMDDSERDTIRHGELVIVQRRMVGPDAAFNLVQRSMRQINNRYPDLGLWFADYNSEDPELEADDIWREAEPTAPRRSLDDYANDIADPEERARALAQNQALRDAFQAADERRKRGEPPSERVQQAMKLMEDPEFVRRADEGYQRWKLRLVGKVIRILIPADPAAIFGAGGWGAPRTQ